MCFFFFPGVLTKWKSPGYGSPCHGSSVCELGFFGGVKKGKEVSGIRVRLFSVVLKGGSGVSHVSLNSSFPHVQNMVVVGTHFTFFAYFG